MRGRSWATLAICWRSSIDSERVGRLRSVSTNLSVSAFFACSAGETDRLRVSGRFGFSASIICCDDGLGWAMAAPAGRISMAAMTERAMLDFSVSRYPDMVLSPDGLHLMRPERAQYSWDDDRPGR